MYSVIVTEHVRVRESGTESHLQSMYAFGIAMVLQKRRGCASWSISERMKTW